MSAPEDQAAPSSPASDEPLVESPAAEQQLASEQPVVSSSEKQPAFAAPGEGASPAEQPAAFAVPGEQAEQPAAFASAEEHLGDAAPSASAVAALTAPSDAAAPSALDGAPPASAAAPLASASSSAPAEGRPTYIFLGVVAGISLLLDIATKAWAEITLNRRGFEPLELIDGHLAITLAYNRGGAWGILQDVGEMVRKPFFLIVSAAAIWFIVSLYGHLHKSQRALTWGLPLVLGGALGNLSDRITRSQVVDFIDYRANWVAHMNSFIHKYVSGWSLTDHWPTFNVADIAISVGVGLMAVDMFTSHKRRQPEPAPPSASSVIAAESNPS